MNKATVICATIYGLLCLLGCGAGERASSQGELLYKQYHDTSNREYRIQLENLKGQSAVLEGLIYESFWAFVLPSDQPLEGVFERLLDWDREYVLFVLSPLLSEEIDMTDESDWVIPAKEILRNPRLGLPDRRTIRD